MRKIFFFFAAMLVALTASAKSTTLGSDNPKDTHADAISAVVSSYDTIFLKPGIYTESGRIAVSNATKVIKAISDTVIIKTQKDNQVTNGAKVTYDGIFFDGSTIGSYRGFTTADASVGNEYRFNNCEFYNFPKYVITTNSESCSIDSVIVTGCYFHNNTRGNIYFPTSAVDNKETIYGLIVKNSTFANNDASGDWTSIVDVETKASPAENIKVLVDHCTFYNNLTKNADHASVRTHTIKNAEVSNCIFAHPTEYERRATYMDGNPSYAKNCISYNFTVDADKQGHTWMTNRTNCTMGNPYFVDAAKGNFNLKRDWTTGEFSPAIGAGTAGSNIGDPRWTAAAEIIPNVDFEEPYVCSAVKARISGHVTLVNNDSLVYDQSVADGVAKWKMHITKACYISAQLNITATSSSGHCFTVKAINADGDSISAVGEGENKWTKGDQNISGLILIPEAGDYTIVLTNSTLNSETRIKGITLTKADDVRTMYFKPGVWDTNNGGDAVKFAIWCFNGAVEDSWSEFMTLVDGKTDIYSTVIGASYNKVIFVRLNGSLDEPAWGTDKVYNQTSEELEPIPSGKNLMLITDWSAGSWKEYKETLGDGWYLIGKFDNVEEWTIDKLSAEKKFTLNSGHEFMITTELLVGDEFKAGYVYYDEITDIKPAGDNYIVDADHAGTDKTIYFNEAGEGGDDWFAHTFYIEKNSATSLDNVLDTEKAVKAIENGQLVIIKNGVRYNVLGTVVR